MDRRFWLPLEVAWSVSIPRETTIATRCLLFVNVQRVFLDMGSRVVPVWLKYHGSINSMVSPGCSVMFYFDSDESFELISFLNLKKRALAIRVTVALLVRAPDRSSANLVY